ncbi:hypothetical protein HOH45_01935 [bacterium]|jgi:hypothetical protein|nr:hypothetical protein [bacterium]
MNSSPVIGISASAYNLTPRPATPPTSSSPKIEHPETIERVGTPKEDVILRSAILDPPHSTESIESSTTKPRLPSDEWIEKHKSSLFRLIGYKIIDKKLAVAKLNLEIWGVPERLFEIVNATDKKGKSPLEYAIDWRSPGHIKMLRKYGAIVTEDMVNSRCAQALTYIRNALTIT